MKVTDFSFNLPEELIAFYPKQKRSSSRLLQLDGVSGQCQHTQFSDLTQWLNAGDLLVFNNTKVIPARLYGHKPTGGKVEILIERILEGQRVLAHVKASKALQPEHIVLLEKGYQLKMLGRQGMLFELEFATQETVLQVLNEIGHIPLPPYIEREDTQSDQERYQTVYAEREGAVAAPTAGLHFDEALLAQIRDKGVKTAFVTLHVGAGTFQPVRVDNINDHVMHSEYFEVAQDVIAQIEATRNAGQRVIAVGTTSVRAVESAFARCTEHSSGQAITGETDIFIYPGYVFQGIDAMITNFHLPESTLMMLVSAFSGYKNIMHAYQEAIAQKYRFFSYGDAMLLQCQSAVPPHERKNELPSLG